MACSLSPRASVAEAGTREGKSRRAILLFQELQNFRGVCLRIADRDPMLLDRAIRRDQRGRADRPFDGFALRVLPWPPGAIALHDTELWIGEQYERQIEFSRELIMRVDAVSADTYHNGIGFGYGFDSVAEPARFFSSARGIVLRIKPKNYVLACIVR
jgi:hypothetical protein